MDGVVQYVVMGVGTAMSMDSKKTRPAMKSASLYVIMSRHVMDLLFQIAHIPIQTVASFTEIFRDSYLTSQTQMFGFNIQYRRTLKYAHQVEVIRRFVVLEN